MGCELTSPGCLLTPPPVAGESREMYYCEFEHKSKYKLIDVQWFKLNVNDGWEKIDKALVPDEVLADGDSFCRNYFRG